MDATIHTVHAIRRECEKDFVIRILKFIKTLTDTVGAENDYCAARHRRFRRRSKKLIKLLFIVNKLSQRKKRDNLFLINIYYSRGEI